MFDQRDLSRITLGEEYTIERQRAGVGQRKRAKQLGLSREDYIAIEHSHDSAGPEIKLSLPDLMRIARARAGMTGAQIAQEMGVSRMWLYDMERIGHDRLRAYWEKKGFIFPEKALYTAPKID